MKKRSGKKHRKYFRDVEQSDDFLKQWDRLEDSEQHDMQRLKTGTHSELFGR